jgi:hypothetical protein
MRPARGVCGEILRSPAKHGTPVHLEKALTEVLVGEWSIATVRRRWLLEETEAVPASELNRMARNPSEVRKLGVAFACAATAQVGSGSKSTTGNLPKEELARDRSRNPLLGSAQEHAGLSL